MKKLTKYHVVLRSSAVIILLIVTILTLRFALSNNGTLGQVDLFNQLSIAAAIVLAAICVMTIIWLIVSTILMIWLNTYIDRRKNFKRD